MLREPAETLFEGLSPEDGPVEPAPVEPELAELGRRLPRLVRLGCSSWNFPGWRGLVYGVHSGERRLASEGIAAYSSYPIFRTVGVDRNFYRPMRTEDFARLGAGVPEDFRFLIKAPRQATDPYVRSERGRPLRPNPDFLNVDWLLERFIGPVEAGLGDKAGPLVLQFSPWPREAIRAEVERLALIERFDAFFRALRARTDRLLAAEYRNYEWLTPRMMRVMRASGIRPVVGLHPSMPPLRRQILALRFYETGVRSEAPGGDWRLTGPLVVRWSLAAHSFYDTLKTRWAPYDRIQAADPATRALLAALIERAAANGVEAYAVANNKAEGSAPLTMRAIAEGVVRLDEKRRGLTRS